MLCFIAVVLLLRKLYCQRLNGKFEQDCWSRGISRGQGRICGLPSFGIFHFYSLSSCLGVDVFSC
jgi:hypothetical protein